MSRLRRRDPASPDPYRIETRRLPSGRIVQLRPIHAADAETIAAAFPLLTEEEVRRRFLHPVKALGAEYLYQLCHPDPDDAYVVVASEPLPPGDGLVGAVARLARDHDDRDRAEFGLLVSRFIAGQGVGVALMARLVEWARARGLREIWGDVLEDNAPMLELADALGFRREPSPESATLRRVTLPIV